VLALHDRGRGQSTRTERISLETVAVKSRWRIVNPPALIGRSGITHRFDLVVMNGQEVRAFDICERLSEIDVIRIYLKKLDTGASVCIVCHAKRMTEGVRRLVSEYGLKALHSDEVELAFGAKIMRTQSECRGLASVQSARDFSPRRIRGRIRS